MAMRTITAPGIEIIETDKSGYSPAMTGTACLITGFATKGEYYTPMQFTSRLAWLNYYGEPTTEEQRYFYSASMEVLNQNGILNCCRLPYKNEALNKVAHVVYSVADTSTSELSDSGYTDILSSDASITEFTTIEVDSTGMCDLSTLNEYRTSEATPTTGTFEIFDKTFGVYGSIPEDTRKGAELEFIGVLPVITTAANALLAQNLISLSSPADISAYEVISGIKTISADIGEALATDFAIPLNSEGVLLGDSETLSKDANNFFSVIDMNDDGTFNRESMKKIGVIVYKMFLDAGNGNKIGFTPVEAFTGSLCKTDKNPNTGVSTFIDTIVNSQSKYIEFYSNCFASPVTKANYEKLDILVSSPSVNVSLGFLTEFCVQTISLSESILKALPICFSKLEDINERNIDIVCDAGVANIAEYLTATGLSEGGIYDPVAQSALWVMKKNDDTKMWKYVEGLFNTFCSKTRKDCMFIADGLRPFCLIGQTKIVRPSKPENTIDANILPFIKYMSGLNTSYGAGYCDWFQTVDEFTGNTYWLPPSIKAMGCYINTDVNFNYWDAPAGLTRGIVPAVDVAFSPTVKQAGSLYDKNWNYSINYPNDGIVLEGQKTFQVKPSAFDRVNVRRLFLRLERAAYQVARYFVYEGNTAYVRQRLVDMLDPYFKEAKVGGGVYDYLIVCDESNNTPDSIDRNELHVSIGIKPTKTIEFIMINFVAVSTGGSFEEAMG